MRLYLFEKILLPHISLQILLSQNIISSPTNLLIFFRCCQYRQLSRKYLIVDLC